MTGSGTRALVQRAFFLGAILAGVLLTPGDARAVQIPVQVPGPASTLSLLSWFPIQSNAEGELVDIQLARNEEPEVLDNWVLVTVVRVGDVLEYRMATWWPNGCFGSDERGWVVQPKPFHQTSVDQRAELIEVSIRSDNPQITLEEAGGARIRYTHRCAVAAVDAWIVEVFE